MVGPQYLEDISYENGKNAFVFEPEYPEHEIEERLRAYLLANEGSSRDESTKITAERHDCCCQCENCIEMTNIEERVCCQSSAEIIGDKVGNNKCISLTDGFRDVCLNKNVLEAALGSWHIITDENLDISNKSYRFIAYRQYISWIFGWLGKDVRKVIPACAVNKIRMNFPAPDGNYVPYKDIHSGFLRMSEAYDSL